MNDITPELIEFAKLRDTRFAVVSRAIAVETDLRDNHTIQILMSAVRADAEKAMEEIAEASPADTMLISTLLVKIRTLVYVRRTLNTILRMGAEAEATIRAEDQRENGE